MHYRYLFHIERAAKYPSAPIFGDVAQYVIQNDNPHSGIISTFAAGDLRGLSTKFVRVTLLSRWPSHTRPDGVRSTEAKNVTSL